MPQDLQFVVNEKGEKVRVILDFKEYERMLEELDELECIREYDAAKASGETAIPFEQAMTEARRATK